MKKLSLTFAILFLVSMVSGCAGAGGFVRVPGGLFSDYTYAETGDGSLSRVGTATCKSYLGWIAEGDCSVSAAARSGGITNVGSVSRKVKNILNLYAENTTVVTGS